MSPGAKLAEEAELIWWPIDGYAFVCDVCGEEADRIEEPDMAIVCKQHRREAC